MYNINFSIAIAVKGEDVYFSALYYNALLRMNLRTGRTEYLCSFEKEKKIIGIHLKAFCHKSSVWFMPQYGEYIACYDIDKNKMEYFDFPGKIYDRPCMEKYCLNVQGERIVPKYSDAGWIDKENIYLIPAGTETAVILNLETKKMSNISNIINSENEYFGCGTYYEEKIWMAPYEGNQLVSLDIHTGEISRIDCEQELGIFYGICGYKGKIWFSSRTEEGVLFLDIQKQKYGKMPCRGIDFKPGKETYRGIVNFNDTLWMMPYEAEKIIYLNAEEKCFIEYDRNIEPGWGVMMIVNAEDDSMYAVSDTYNYLICLHKERADYDIYTPAISVSQLYDILNCNYGENALIMLMERYHGAIPEKKIVMEDYISLLMFYSFAGNKQSGIKIQVKSFIGKTGQVCFEYMKKEK